ncbi:hypothetical protein GCM10010260_83530 [Streptomyces filipinensis]|uniref:Uncharacterized protein n=1 Tax=Streptomyces filipinensis TaxID=66887 RepID=A0A918IK67_9ACTN|nr:hypothetical protein GCM10010260_83530 [Streptomyces filipinensis]
MKPRSRKTARTRRQADGRPGTSQAAVAAVALTRGGGALVPTWRRRGRAVRGPVAASVSWSGVTA